MKNLKKVMALIMAMVMVLAMSVTAYADGEPLNTEGKVKVAVSDTATSKHVYKVYQLFKGDVAADGKTLSNITYGANYGSGTTLNATDKERLETLATNAASGEAAAADAFAKDIFDELSGDPVATLTKEADTTNNWPAFTTYVEPGYYLIVDDTSVALDEKSGDAYSKYILKVVEETTVAPKKETTSVDKKITTDTLGTSTTTVNGKVDNVSIGDTVNFEITGTVPATAADYDYYYFILGDTLTNGLTFDSTSVVVTATTPATATTQASTDTLYEGDVADTTDVTETQSYQLYTGNDADGKTFQIALTDAKARAGQTITVTYSAKLNENAKIGETSNDNTVTIEYSNDPSHNYNGDKDEDTPGKPDSEKDVPLGETPESKTQTYSTAIQLQKVDQDGKILTGAGFTISGGSAEIVLVSSESFTENANGTYWKLNDNKTYTSVAPTEEAMVLQTEAVTESTTGYVQDDTAEGEDVIEFGGHKYRPFNYSTDADRQVYTHVESNESDYASTSVKYAKTVTYEQKNTKTSGVTATAEVGADGVVTFKGLGAGTYTISETTVPNGYNKLDDIEFNITFDKAPGTGEYHWTTTTDDATYNHETGTFELTVENQKGTTLPETGGIGTTLFYIAGAILVIGAGVVLITRRRMSAR